MSAFSPTSDTPRPAADAPAWGDAAQLWSALTEDAYCFVAVFDRARRFVFVNTMAERFVQASGLAGRVLDDVLPPEIARRAAEMIQRALTSTGPVVSEGYFRDALIRATWRRVRGPDAMLDRVLVVATAPGVAGQAPAAGADVVREPPPDTEAVARLSRREIEVLGMMGRGLSVPRVAAALHRSARTIESHRLSIGKKLGIRNQSELTRFAIRAGLVSPDTPIRPARANGSPVFGDN